MTILKFTFHRLIEFDTKYYIMRKKTNTLIIALIFLYSCNNQSPQKKISIDELSNLTDTIGYYAARNMKGLASFKIGESTYSETINQLKEEIRKDSRRFKETNYKESPQYSGYEEKYLDFKFDKKGNIANQFYREDFGSIFEEIKYDTISRYLKKDILNREIFGCPNIKELGMFEYYIGDIKIRSLKLKFYKDTLYQISCTQNNKIEEGFKAKYGNGRLINNSVWKTPRGETNVRPENEEVLKKSQLLKIDEKIIWENESIKTESQTYCKYKYEGDKFIEPDLDSYNSYFNIWLKNELKMNEIKDCENAAYKTKKRLEEQSKQKDINQL